MLTWQNGAEQETLQLAHLKGRSEFVPKLHSFALQQVFQRLHQREQLLLANFLHPSLVGQENQKTNPIHKYNWFPATNRHYHSTAAQPLRKRFPNFLQLFWTFLLLLAPAGFLLLLSFNSSVLCKEL